MPVNMMMWEDKSKLIDKMKKMLEIDPTFAEDLMRELVDWMKRSRETSQRKIDRQLGEVTYQGFCTLHNVFDGLSIKKQARMSRRLGTVYALYVNSCFSRDKLTARSETEKEIMGYFCSHYFGEGRDLKWEQTVGIDQEFFDELEELWKAGNWREE